MHVLGGTEGERHRWREGGVQLSIFTSSQTRAGAIAGSLLIFQNKLTHFLPINMFGFIKNVLSGGRKLSDMEKLFEEYPLSPKEIFEELDNKNLTKCRQVCKLWRDFIDNEKIVWNRILMKFPSGEGMYFSRFRTFSMYQGGMNVLSFYRFKIFLSWSTFSVSDQKFIYALSQSQIFCARKKKICIL